MDVRTTPGTAASKLQVEERGDGDALLLLQGLGQGMWVWRDQVRAFAASFRTIAYDTRGTGRSPVPLEPYGIGDLADDAAEILGGRAAHVVALSMGGYVALTLALARPELVRSLVLVGTGAGWTERNPERFEAILAARLEHPTPYETIDAHVNACYGFYAEGCDVERIDVPALVVHGDQDLIVPVENGRRLAARLPNARYVELPGRGHNLPLEEPETINRLVLEFLEA